MNMCGFSPQRSHSAVSALAPFASRLSAVSLHSGAVNTATARHLNQMLNAVCLFNASLRRSDRWTRWNAETYT